MEPVATRTHGADARVAAPGRYACRAKRALDVAGATIALPLAAPLLAVAAILVKIEDRGPVFFRQERVGMGGRTFSILKLRTMVVGAEHRGPGLRTARDDARITRLGRVLRRTSIDELPQLLQVLRGQMSLVGPRPTVASQVARYSTHQRRRLEVKPGIAGWAQLNGRNTIPWESRIELDLWYIDHWTLGLDLAILARTAWQLLRGSPTYGVDGLNDDFGVDPFETRSGQDSRPVTIATHLR
jgi:lipopolysaccharide/colanic/teichoic acid biosynthesis glycosyltransferase